MGGLVIRPQTPHEVLCQLNSRFAPGEALQEMVANHSQFRVFAHNNSLVQIYKLLNIGPADYDERARYHSFLEHLRRVPSDVAGMDGHDRIVKARRDNLESSSPLPMYTTTHSAADDPRVTVTQGQPLPHDSRTYIIISTPASPPRPGRSARPVAGSKRPAAGAKRSARKKA
jgi:hypothetical protein